MHPPSSDRLQLLLLAAHLHRTRFSIVVIPVRADRLSISNTYIMSLLSAGYRHDTAACLIDQSSAVGLSLHPSTFPREPALLPPSRQSAAPLEHRRNLWSHDTRLYNAFPTAPDFYRVTAPRLRRMKSGNSSSHASCISQSIEWSFYR